MISIQELTEEDVGRIVMYIGGVGKDPLSGNLTSWNDHFIFVRFRGPGGEACMPEDLIWAKDIEIWMAEQREKAEKAEREMACNRSETWRLIDELKNLARSSGEGESSSTCLAAAARIEELVSLVNHCWVHSSYQNLGYLEMDEKMKRLYEEVKRLNDE